MKNMIRTFLTAGGLLVLFSSMPSFAQEHDVLQRMADREAIEELMWRYTRALDSFDPDAYVAVFTEDGSFGDIKGRDALHKMMSDFRDGRAQQTDEGNTPAPMFHATKNYWTEFISPTHARHHAYWVTYFGANGPDSPARMIAVGRGVDDLVKVNGQWLIQSRNVAPTAE